MSSQQSSTTPTTMPIAPETETEAESAIRALIEDWSAALRARDLDRLVRHYAPDVIFFDLVPPLSQRSAGAYRQKWENMLPMFSGEIGYEVSGLRIIADGTTGFAHCLNRISDLSRGAPGPWVRITLGFRKWEGVWKVVHEHISAPIRMESLQAAMDLHP